jgi:uncharacterized membrane protein YoaK (UPF0700 family)
MIGDVTQIVIDLGDLVRGSADPRSSTRLVLFLGPLAAFAIGRIMAAFGSSDFSFSLRPGCFVLF